MSIVSRSEIYVKAERGGDWLDEFLRIYSDMKTQPSSIDDILSAINNKRGETVESVLQKYREQTGLNAITSGNYEPNQTKTASFTPLSIRHATINANPNNVLTVIQKDPTIQKAIDSLCEHSGGNKGTHSIINFLRNKLGKELVSYTDQDLIKYIEDRKKSFKKDEPVEDMADVGKAGLDGKEQYGDDVADYIQHGQPGK
jgi:hypothetical protein